MTVLPIYVAPHPLLSQRSDTVDSVTPDITTLIEDMFETMYASNGIGLAAVQVGVLKRIIVIDTEWGSSRYVEDNASASDVPVGNPILLINPEIVSHSTDTRIYEEGCLSFPGQYSDVVRPDQVTIRYMDKAGQPQTLEADGLLSTCIQHEIDHINGVVFVDHISRMKRDMILRKLKKQQKHGQLNS